MSYEAVETQNDGSQKKTYVAPQLTNLDSVKGTQGKGSTSFVENAPYSNIS